MTISAIRPAHVRSWVAGLVASGLAPSTVKGIYLTATQVFGQAVSDGLIGRSPCIGVRLPEERQREEMHFLSPDQVAILGDAVDPRFQALVYAAYTGMRAGELAALRVDRLNLLGGTVDVLESMMEVGGKLIVGPTKTGRPRTLTLPASWPRCSVSTSAATRHTMVSSSPSPKAARSGSGTSTADTSSRRSSGPASRKGFTSTASATPVRPS